MNIPELSNISMKANMPINLIVTTESEADIHLRICRPVDKPQSGGKLLKTV